MSTSSAPAAPPIDASAWWLDGGEEVCPTCDQAYALVVEVRCPDCDRPSCSLCAVAVRRGRVEAVVCRDCCDTDEAD